jgi:hypothetical protein
MSSAIAASSGKDKSIRVKVLSVRNLAEKASVSVHVKLATTLGECKTNTVKSDAGAGSAEWNETFTIACDGVQDSLSVVLREDKVRRPTAARVVPESLLTDHVAWPPERPLARRRSAL